MATRKQASDALGEPGSLKLAADEPFFVAGDVAVDLQAGDATMER